MACEQRRGGWIGRLGSLRAIPGLLLIGALVAGGVQLGRAQTPAANESDAPPGDPAEALDVPGRPTSSAIGGGGDPGLDDLLRLPSDFETRPTEQPVAGASEDEWRRRFVRAEKAIGDARKALTETKKELDGLAETGGSSQWSVAPPGASGQQTTSPLSFKLRQQLQRQREELDEAEKALRELRIEADLAGVPAAWRVVAANQEVQSVPH